MYIYTYADVSFVWAGGGARGTAGLRAGPPDHHDDKVDSDQQHDVAVHRHRALCRHRAPPRRHPGSLPPVFEAHRHLHHAA